MTQNPTLGYIGTGLMGQPMSARLLAADFDLTVWNRTVAKALPLVDAGATMGANPADVASKSDIVFLCLTDTKAVQEAVFGENGVASGARKSMPCAAQSSSTPKIRLRFSVIGPKRRAPWAAMLTWSS